MVEYTSWREKRHDKIHLKTLSKKIKKLLKKVLTKGDEGDIIDKLTQKG